MKLSPFHPRSLSARLALALSVTALLLTGCVTSTEVRDIVRQSNTDSVTALGEQLVAEAGSPAALAPATGDGSGEAPDAIARLSAFVEQHPDNKVTQNALLLRLAFLHLNRGALELARATFERIDPAQLRSARDQGLLAVQAHLLWWRGVAQLRQPGVFASVHGAEAESARRDLLARATAQGAPEALRDYLLELRAHIGLKLAADLIDKSAARALLEDSVNACAAALGEAETAQLATGRLDPATRPFDAATRRLLRMQGLLEAVADAWRSEPAEFQPVFTNTGCLAHYRRSLR